MKRFVYCFLAGLLCLACRQAARQPAWVITEPTSPVPNAPGREYPKNNPDLSVTFRATDADVAGATDVVLDICGKRYPMVHADGYWEATSDPLVPGFHYYFLRLDGRQTADPASRHFYGCGMMSSGIEIPEEGMEYHLEQDVPHGRISKMTYHSNYTDSERVLYVYTPAGYDEASDTRYPVVYIQHGGGEDETGWPTQGHMNYILDNLIAAVKAVPMIIVSANSNRHARTAPRRRPCGLGPVPHGTPGEHRALHRRNVPDAGRRSPQGHVRPFDGRTAVFLHRPERAGDLPVDRHVLRRLLRQQPERRPDRLRFRGQHPRYLLEHCCVQCSP